jgi:phospholipase D1/2
MAKILLHGTLHVTIYGARGIVTPQKKHHPVRRFLTSFIESATDAIVGDSEYYGTVDLDSSRVGRTRVLKDHEGEPIWNESFRIYCCHTVSTFTVSIKDASIPGTVVVGRAHINADTLIGGEELDDWHQLYRGEDQVDGQVHVKLKFYEASHDPHWGEGIADPRYKGVPYCYYPQRKGCKVTLYQDAHMEDGFLPSIYQAGGQTRQPTRCWEDVFTAINEARHLIYITGWSVYCEILLVRDPNRPIPGSEGLTLGELLKKKASEGVRVNLLVWDDRTSVEVFHKDGLMATHDEDTEAYFAGSDVHCHLCPRNPDNSLSVVQGLAIGNMFTHHQKTIIVDAPLPGADTGRRRIMSFVGGIDLCDGRYDNQNHSLFRTLNDLNMNDFHQPNYPGTSTAKGGPREPWHDIHSRVEGPVAWDVLWNFEQRWQKQADKELLISIRDIDTIDPPSAVAEEDDPDTWNVQLFRSIDAGAAFGFPDDPETVARAGLTCGKDNTIDRSIQDAYINAIRRAKNFIYIENQYFLGSCFAWKTDQDAGALHIIPAELTRKICSKIEDGERFTVYCVVPMWPEGIPESGSVQAILDWQHKTMEFMYTEIATAIRAAGIDAHPRDYLTFFCLANRETKMEGELEPTEQPEEGSNYEAAQRNRRFMIYVHSKMLIADDEYTIIGSANINQRSLDGARDSEICIGAYQPYHLCAQRPPRSHVHGFRMSLWYEHIGKLDNLFLQPWSVECIRKVNQIGDRYWDMWAGEEVVDMPGHLLSYPIDIDEDGNVTAKVECFPDTQAKVLGTKSDTLPSILTT